MTITFTDRPRREQIEFLSGDGDCLNFAMAVYAPANEGFTTEHVFHLLDTLYEHLCELYDSCECEGRAKYQLTKAIYDDEDVIDGLSTLNMKGKITLIFI